MPERSNDNPPHPFDLGPDEHAVHYGPGVHVGAPDADRGVRLDQLTDDPADEHLDEERPVSPRRRTSGRRPTTRTRSTTTTTQTSRSGKGRRSTAEIALGAAMVAAGLGLAAYFLATGPLGLSGEAGVGVGAYVAGLCSSAVIYPLWRAARVALGRFITPGASR